MCVYGTLNPNPAPPPQANCLEPDGGAEDEYVFWARKEATTEAAAEATTSASRSGRPAVRRRGPVGLWPEAAMLNHSCIPNTVTYIVG